MSNIGISLEQKIMHAVECCKLANDRFLIQYALKLTLESISIDSAIAIQFVRNGDIEEFKKLLNKHKSKS